METQENEKSNYVAYEFLTVDVKKDFELIYTDCYENLGWQSIYNSESENLQINPGLDLTVNLKFKRDRKIKNRSMLVSLQKKCEGALKKIDKLEKSKEFEAMIVSLSTGIAGLLSLTGAVFSFLTGETGLTIVLTLFAFVGFAFPLYFYKRIKADQELKVGTLIQEQYDIIYDVCERAKNLIA